MVSNTRYIHDLGLIGKNISFLSIFKDIHNLDIESPDKATQYPSSPLPTKERRKEKQKAKRQLFPEIEVKQLKMGSNSSEKNTFIVCPICGLDFLPEKLMSHGPICANETFDQI